MGLFGIRVGGVRAGAGAQHGGNGVVHAGAQTAQRGGRQVARLFGVQVRHEAQDTARLPIPFQVGAQRGGCQGFQSLRGAAGRVAVPTQGRAGRGGKRRLPRQRGEPVGGTVQQPLQVLAGQVGQDGQFVFRQVRTVQDAGGQGQRGAQVGQQATDGKAGRLGADPAAPAHAEVVEGVLQGAGVQSGGPLKQPFFQHAAGAFLPGRIVGAADRDAQVEGETGSGPAFEGDRQAAGQRPEVRGNGVGTRGHPVSLPRPALPTGAARTVRAGPVEAGFMRGALCNFCPVPARPPHAMLGA